MPKIRVLPDILSNKIAAGEVVERPASVVKELLENSLDAGSTSIELSVERGGLSLIRIADNGHGMTPDDALLSLERYATSKIVNDADLFAIKTLGFRGEALPSIASVSSFELVSRARERESGIRIRAEGGKILEAMETGAAPGTVISISRLFFNVPARRKFLKSEATEMGHIADTFLSTALPFPQVQFRLLHNGKTLRHLGSGDDLLRAMEVLGKEFEKNLYPVGQEGGGIRVRGWVASPDISRSNSQRIYLYVNGRHIRDRAIHQALCEGYRGRLMTGRYPVAVLFLEVDPDKVDVNVHPTKHEVRFSDSRAVWSAVRDGVSSALSFEDRAKWQAARLSQKEEQEEIRAIVASRSTRGLEPEGEPRFRKTSENSSASGERLEAYEPVALEGKDAEVREKPMEFTAGRLESTPLAARVNLFEKDDFLWKK
ncbi:DNA mismatch repair endonuclease MutL, partial [Desulfococcaceae bacterium OttesenSCG-928-F15]|nr:DNA mismatch repair endonuclease MutL [Desulfococcaceae bacterium OttesenSCG-928-F15]